MKLRRWLVVLGLVVGAILRATLLPLPGTEDLLDWKIWSHAAAHDPTAIYGVGGSPPERRMLRWQNQDITAEYPPLAIDELAVVGRVYRLMSPAFDDSTMLTIAVKLPGIAADIVLVTLLLTWGRRRFGDGAATAAMIYWLNPAVLLNGAALGYLDPQMAVPAVLGLMAIFAGRPAWAGAALALAVLTKPQPLVVVPVLTMALLAPTVGRWGRAAAAIAGAALATIALVTPVVVRGAWWNMVQAVSRMGAHDMLSGQSANVWWIFTYVLRVMDVWQEWGPAAAIGQKVRILAITRATALGYPNARLVGVALVAVAIGALMWRAWRTASPAAIAALCGWSAWTYALFAPQAHENHLYLAVPFAALAAGLDRRYRPLCWTVSIIAALNLYLFEGLGIGWPPIIDRTGMGLDATVVLALVNVIAFGWLWRGIFAPADSSAIADMPSA